MTEKKLNQTQETRRHFLRTVMAGGGAAAAVATVGVTSQAQAQALPEAAVEAESQGYHETQHIRDYYARAAF